MSRSRRPKRDGRDGREGAKGDRREKRGSGRDGKSRKGPKQRRTQRSSDHLVPGERAVVELLRASPGRVKRLLVEDGREFSAVRALAEDAGVQIEGVEREVLDELVGASLARGVLALARPPKRWAVEDLLEQDEGPRTRRGHQLIVACDGVVDPHNLGAIIRSAEFFGALGVVWPRDRSAPLSPAAVRSSAGASERVSLAECTNLARVLEQAKARDWWVVGTVVDEGQPLHRFAEDPPQRMVLVVGSEQRGMRRLTRERCDVLLTITRGGSLGSLNVSAAAAVCLSALG